jgi:hypothetical protein
MPFGNAIVGGMSKLIRQAIESFQFVSGVSGWRIARNGDAEFNNAVIRGQIEVGPDPGRHVEIDSTNLIVVYNSDNNVVARINDDGIFVYDETGAFASLDANEFSNAQLEISGGAAGTTPFHIVAYGDADSALTEIRGYMPFNPDMFAIMYIRGEDQVTPELPGFRFTIGGLNPEGYFDLENLTLRWEEVPVYLVTDTGLARCSADTAITTTPTPVPGASLSLTVAKPFSSDGRWVARAFFDFSCVATAATICIGELTVDGVTQTGRAIFDVNTTGDRLTVGQQWEGSGLASGSHTFELEVSKTANVGSYDIKGTHTSLSVDIRENA